LGLKIGIKTAFLYIGIKGSETFRKSKKENQKIFWRYRKWKYWHE